MRQILRVGIILVSITLALINIERCHSCLEEERIGLLEIKAWMTDRNGIFWNLRDWVNGDCCEWHGVECNNITNRVTELDLSSTWTPILHFMKVTDLYVDASLFLPFKDLKSLNLEANELVGCFEKQGFEVLASGLSKFEELVLRLNDFNDSILSSFSGLSSLKSLDLSGTKLTGSTGINGLRNLKILYLDGNKMKENVLIESLGALPSLETLYARSSKFKGTQFGEGLSNSTSLQGLFLDDSSLPANVFLNIGSLSTLKVLSMIRVDLIGTLPAQVPLGQHNLTQLEELLLDFTSPITTSFLGYTGPLPALKILSLQGSGLNGTLLFDQGWCELKNLEQLYLPENNLQGILPRCLGNLSSLQVLDLSDNQFEGIIALSPLSHLMMLEFLAFSNNNFQVPVSFASFTNHSNLKFIAFDNNELIAKSSTFQPLAPKFQLRFLSASNCTPKPLKTEFPDFLHSQYNLMFLDLSYNNFIGHPFPFWLVENNTRLSRLSLRETSLTGPLQLPQHPAPNLRTIDISDNNIDGQIARNTCLIVPRIQNFMLACNKLTGCVPACLENMTSLSYLDLSNNQLSCGKMDLNLPTTRSLWFLKLSNNNFSGRLPPSVFNMTNLRYLFLDGNKFAGEVSGTFSTARELLVLDISNNLLSGMLPRGLAASIVLQAIDLSKNHFVGTIPEEFFRSQLVEFLDLSENNLSGPIPFGFNAPSLRYFNLYGNQLSGPFPYALYRCSSLVTLDLGNNNFTGPTPKWIYKLRELSILLLRANRLDGQLPVQLCWLKKLSILDLSQNNFSGLLPSCLSNLNFSASGEKTLALIDYMSLDEEDRSKILAAIGGRKLGNKGFNLRSKVLWPRLNVEIVVEFTTKKNYYSYKGNILKYLSGMDLSGNRFVGEIPREWGNLIGINALNLSHNDLPGSIPPTFSNLGQIESLDLSYNNLNGRIPPQLTELNFLAVFNVSYNNLSGKTPEMKNQFGTFDESSYLGNPLLCGPLLKNNCSQIQPPSKGVPNDSNDGLIDMDSFYVSFGVSYVIVVLTIAAVLRINQFWRCRWFYFIEECIDTCYCFVVINFRKLSNYRRA